MVDLIAIATSGFFAPPAGGPSLVAIATLGFFAPGAVDPGPDPEPSDVDGALVAEIRLDRPAGLAIRLDLP
jgi:hypothetical protein